MGKDLESKCLQVAEGNLYDRVKGRTRRCRSTLETGKDQCIPAVAERRGKQNEKGKGGKSPSLVIRFREEKKGLTEEAHEGARFFVSFTCRRRTRKYGEP